MNNLKNPLIIQSDQTIFLEVHHPDYELTRDKLSSFAELIKSPEHIHTYSISQISLWNASSAGITKEDIYDFLKKKSKYEIPDNVFYFIDKTLSKFGKAELYKSDDENYLYLKISDPDIIEELKHHNNIWKLFVKQKDFNTFLLNYINRGTIKQLFIDIGYPINDYVGFSEGEAFPIELRKNTLMGIPFELREYQKEASNIFYSNNSKLGGHGVVVLPCGSGKTMVGMSIMEKIQMSTLILTANVAACHQWINELIDKSYVDSKDIGEFSGEKKEIKPITVATYQIVIYRKRKGDDYPHFSLFRKKNWGLIIYDEVHLLPAPVFRATAEIQSKRRLGLTATLIREDGKEKDVFSLIGPKRYDAPWKELENKGYISEAVCYEIRILMKRNLRLEYMSSGKRAKFRLASSNEEKLNVVASLLERHTDDQVLIIGQYIDQLNITSKRFSFPIITGKTNNSDRDNLYQAFRSGHINVLVVSKVANFAIDLPDASVVIQLSGTYGSRQEEAQRLGRILRPKRKTSYFYTIISKNSSEEEFAHKRQLFLTEQGYKYIIEDWDKN